MVLDFSGTPSQNYSQPLKIKYKLVPLYLWFYSIFDSKCSIQNK